MSDPPKKRGRKPGTKNKPKVQQISLIEEELKLVASNSKETTTEITYTVLGHGGMASKEQREVLYSGANKILAFEKKPDGVYHTVRYQEWVDGEKIRVQKLEGDGKLVVEFSMEEQLTLQIERQKEILAEMEAKLGKLKSL
jgi:hypothetical protein